MSEQVIIPLSIVIYHISPILLFDYYTNNELSTNNICFFTLKSLLIVLDYGHKIVDDTSYQVDIDPTTTPVYL